MATFTHQVFADESGNDPAQPCFVHAGYLSTVCKWEALTEAWDRCLSAWGLDWFHMTEAEGLRGDYSTWSEDTKNERVACLARIVESHIMNGFACDMKWSEWLAHVEGGPIKPLKKTIATLAKHPYLASLHYFLVGVSKKCKELGIETRSVKVVLGSKDKIREREWSAIMRLVEALGFPKPAFEDAADFAPLQAADMLAWCIFQSCGKAKEDRPIGVRHYPLFERLSVLRITPKVLEIPALKFTFEIIPPGTILDKKPVGQISLEDLLDLIEDPDGDEPA
jgi:hypothetical protein